MSIRTLSDVPCDCRTKFLTTFYREIGSLRYHAARGKSIASRLNFAIPTIQEDPRSYGEASREVPSLIIGSPCQTPNTTENSPYLNGHVLGSFGCPEPLSSLARHQHRYSAGAETSSYREPPEVIYPQRSNSFDEDRSAIPATLTRLEPPVSTVFRRDQPQVPPLQVKEHRSALPKIGKTHDFIYETGTAPSEDLDSGKPRRRGSLERDHRAKVKSVRSKGQARRRGGLERDHLAKVNEVRSIGACWRCRLQKTEVSAALELNSQNRMVRTS